MKPEWNIEDFKKGFFNRDDIIKALGEDRAEALSRLGNSIKERAKNLMRKPGPRSAHSKPGNPPKVHQGNLKKFLYSAYDRQAGVGIVGPAWLTPKKRRTFEPLVTVPNILEYGGYMRFQGVSSKQTGTGVYLPSEVIATTTPLTPGTSVRMENRPYMRRARDSAFNASQLQKCLKKEKQIAKIAGPPVL